MNNKFLVAMLFRHATKEFDDSKKISKEDFETILNYGALSPSAFGFEPWRFLIIQNLQLRHKLKEFTWGAQGTLLTASHFVIILARKKKGMIYSSEYIKYMMENINKLPLEEQDQKQIRYQKFQQQFYKLLDNDRYMFDWACKQTYIALANMMTGAAYMGIDSCPTEGFDPQKAEEFIKNELNIDIQEYGVSVMVPFGYRKNEPKRAKTRQRLTEITQWFN